MIHPDMDNMFTGNAQVVDGLDGSAAVYRGYPLG